MIAHSSSQDPNLTRWILRDPAPAVLQYQKAAPTRLSSAGIAAARPGLPSTGLVPMRCSSPSIGWPTARVVGFTQPLTLHSRSPTGRRTVGDRECNVSG